MDQGDAIRRHLEPSSCQQSHRGELLQELLDTFDMGGSEAVGAVLEEHINELERAFDARLDALNALLP